MSQSREAQSEAPSVDTILQKVYEHGVNVGHASEHISTVKTLKEAKAKINRLIEQAEINLLRDTADGFESVLTTEFEKGGKAAIKALRRMADHKEKALSNNLSKEDA